MKRFGRALLTAALCMITVLCIKGEAMAVEGTFAPLRESTGAGRQAKVNGKYEALLASPVLFDNPYDFRRVSCVVRWLLPDGSVQQTDAFWYVGYERALEYGQEALSPTSLQGWMLRYTPRQSGVYRYSVTLRDEDSGQAWRWPQEGEHAFEATDGYARGFLQVSSRNPAYLCFDDGAPFVGIGHNLCGWEWGGTDNRAGTFEYDTWLTKMQANQANMTQFDFCEGDQLEWTRNGYELPYSADWAGLGRYNQQNAWKMDYRAQRAQELGIYFRLTLFHWEDFDREEENFPDWGWNRNPYNAQNGGPCEDVRAFFSDEESCAHVKNFLRYVVARWGYAPNLLAYELWNEVDAPDMAWGKGQNYGKNRHAITQWHQEMAQFLHQTDVNGHLVTTSHAGSNNGGDIWRLPEIDLSTIHRYTLYNADYGDMPFETVATLNSLIQSRLRQTQKPVLVGEFALSPGGDIQKTQDIAGVAFHQQLWSSVMAQSMCTAMHWTWGSYIERHDLYRLYKPLAAFVADIDLGTLTAVNTIKKDADVRYMALYGDDCALVWAYDRQYTFQRVREGYKPAIMQSATLSLPLENGAYFVRWTDCWTGETVLEQTVAVIDGALVLTVPPFTRDIAARVERREAALLFESVDWPKPRVASRTVALGRRLALFASGGGFSGAADAGRFAHMPARGDFTLTARLTAFTNLGENIRAGLMLRQSARPDAPFAMVYCTPQGRTGFCWRDADGAWDIQGAYVPPGSPLRLVRRGDTVEGQASPRPGVWRSIGAARLTDWPADALAGMAAHAQNDIVYCAARFEDVTWG